ncbi:unnamed protein product [Triticum turgidum subsp. durum]|uniref:Coatomer subunit gamma n=1 Tax=Triticum turgidum subsp. durum TaxID=4567 RepID=A0A9R0V6F5_TRITD|nr:unnamed protein product [Triticum turgidum subsp. durum]
MTLLQHMILFCLLVSSSTERFLRSPILRGLIGTLCRIKESFICSCALWIIGEYSCSLSVVERAISTIKEALGDEPFHAVSQERESSDSSKPTHPAMDSSTVCSKRCAVLSNPTHNLRVFIMSGDFHLAAVVACTLTKLVLWLGEVQPSKVLANKASAESLLIMVSILQLGKSSHLPHPIDSDSYDRIMFCVRLLCRTGNNARKVQLLSSCQSFTKMLAEKQFRKNEKMRVESQNSHAYPDDSIDFDHLKSRRGMCQLELEDEVRDYLKAATGEFMKDAGCANKLNPPVQLTGFSDPVYAEGFVTVNQYYDTVLDITVINRTKETMRNLYLEFATSCKTTVVERSRNYTVAPQAVKKIQANIKLSSTNLGIIISRIVYETSDAMESSELKVNTVLHDEKEFVYFIIKSTNMTCLTPMSVLDGDCGLVAANLYAKSVFGEDALVNISVEKQANCKLSGCITIRGNVQGLVLNLAHAVIVTQQATVDAAMSLSEVCHKYYG